MAHLDANLLGKVYEFQNLINTYNRKLKSQNTSSWEEFKAFQRRFPLGVIPKWVAKLRNKITFHFEAEYIGDQLGEISDDAPLGFFATTHVGNTAFAFAEEIVSLSTMQRVAREERATDAAAGYDTIMSYLTRSVSEIVVFVNAFVGETFDAYGVVVKKSSDEIDRAFFFDPEATSPTLFSSQQRLVSQNLKGFQPGIRFRLKCPLHNWECGTACQPW